jgi:hypothetical protein
MTSDLDRYRRIMTQLDEWKAFVTSPPTIGADSVFGIDVAAGWEEVVNVAWHGVLVAIDHLLLVRDAGTAGRPPAQVLSLPTACRGALLSACRTVWILSATSADVRRARALNVEVESARQAKKAVEELATFLPDDESVAASVTEARDQLAALEERCKTAGISAKKINDTDVIHEAAEHLSFQGPAVRGAIAASWRSLSGYAHGYQWTGKAAVIKPDLSEAVSAVAAAAITTNGALELFAKHLQPSRT